MSSANGPVLIRGVVAKPGMHSHNQWRAVAETNSRPRTLLLARTILLILGLGGISYYGYTLANQYIYQDYENWAFDQQIAGHGPITFADYLRQRTPFGFLVGERTNGTATMTRSAPGPNPATLTAPEPGSVLGKLEIERLDLSAIVREGVDTETLSKAVGHVPSTALAGQIGNFAIAAHRDTLFRGLKDIRDGDIVTFQSPAATYKYEVFSTRIVKPSDISVLRADGGTRDVNGSSNVTPVASRSNELLTMITCYPFFYVGSAPKRFIVQARLIESEAPAAGAMEEAQNARPPTGTAQAKVPKRAVKRHTIHQAIFKEPQTNRGSSRLRPAAKKHGFWHKLFHAS